ncbi:MAG TPA: hypothetical protein VF498_09835 [Anaerolineales bacterium]
MARGCPTLFDRCQARQPGQRNHATRKETICTGLPWDRPPKRLRRALWEAAQAGSL